MPAKGHAFDRFDVNAIYKANKRKQAALAEATAAADARTDDALASQRSAAAHQRVHHGAGAQGARVQGRHRGVRAPAQRRRSTGQSSPAAGLLQAPSKPDAVPSPRYV